MQDNTISTYSQISGDYATRNTMNESIIQMLDIFISLLRGKRVLDIGCAHGRDSKYLNDKMFQVTGIDLTPEFIPLAKQSCPECRFEVMDMRKLTFQDNSFDGIWASASFLHIPKQEALLTLMGFNKTLIKGGLLYISVMEGIFEGERSNPDIGWGPRYMSYYQEDELSSILKIAGFVPGQTHRFVGPSGSVFIHIFCHKV